MKKMPLATIIFLLFIMTMLSRFFNDKEHRTNEVFYNTDMYHYYELVSDNGINIKEYKDMFDEFNGSDYFIYYIDTYDTDINIEVGQEHYLQALDKYVKEYIKLLGDDEEKIAMVQKGNLSIRKMKICATEEIYEALKKETKVSKIYDINQ